MQLPEHQPAFQLPKQVEPSAPQKHPHAYGKSVKAKKANGLSERSRKVEARRVAGRRPSKASKRSLRS